MKRNLLLALVIMSCGLVSFTFIQRKTTIYIIGDSTAANKQHKAYPETGWGMELQSFFKPEIVVDNRALNGRSTKSFRAENQWQPILEKLYHLHSSKGKLQFILLAILPQQINSIRLIQKQVGEWNYNLFLSPKLLWITEL